MKNQRGITLVALVITILVLLILAGITINLVMGNNGIISKAQEAGIEQKKQQIKETIELDLLDLDTEKITQGLNLTIDEALDKILERKNLDVIDKNSQTGTKSNYTIKFIYNNNGRIVIESMTEIKSQ